MCGVCVWCMVCGVCVWCVCVVCGVVCVCIRGSIIMDSFLLICSSNIEELALVAL